MLNNFRRIIKIQRLKFKYKKINTIIKSNNIENNINLGRNCLINKRVYLGNNVNIGDFTYLNSNKYWITIESDVTIGKYCSIAPGVHIGAGNHYYEFVTTHPILFDRYYEKKLKMNKDTQKVNGLKDKEMKTIIGNDVWIGLNAIIKRGIHIGNGAIIAAGSIVVKDVPDYAIVGGNPAKIIKYRTSEENIELFKQNEKNMWWNWNINDIINNIDSMYDFEKYKELIK